MPGQQRQPPHLALPLLAAIGASCTLVFTLSRTFERDAVFADTSALCGKGHGLEVSYADQPGWYDDGIVVLTPTGGNLCASRMEMERIVDEFPSECLSKLAIHHVYLTGMIQDRTGRSRMTIDGRTDPSRRNILLSIDVRNPDFRHTFLHEISHLIVHDHGADEYVKWSNKASYGRSFVSRYASTNTLEDMTETVTYRLRRLEKCSPIDDVCNEKGAVAQRLIDQWCPGLPRDEGEAR